MCKFDKIRCLARILSGLVFLVLFSLLLPMSSSADSSHNAFSRSAVMNIMGKTGDAIVISERSFEVSESTGIFDETGKKIRLNDLQVPCTAVIEYQLRMDQDPLCLKIVVKKKGKGSRQDWSSSDHEGSE